MRSERADRAVDSPFRVGPAGPAFRIAGHCRGMADERKGWERLAHEQARILHGVVRLLVAAVVALVAHRVL